MTAFQPVFGGDIIYAANINALAPRITYKTTTTTRASTTTFADDPDLTTALEASGVYVVEFHLKVAALAAADIKTMWNVPASIVSANRSVLGPGSTALDGNADNIAMKAGVHNYGTTITYNGVRDSAGNQFDVIEKSLVTMGLAGSVTLQWAQGTSNVTGSVVAAGSFVKTTQIA